MGSFIILYDNYGFQKGFEYGWGFSAYIQKDGINILFDFGERWDSLRHNMAMFGISPKDIDIAVLSHDHWDHKGGLMEFIKGNREAEIFIPAGFGGREIFDAPQWKDYLNGREVTVIKERMKIDSGIYTSGAIQSPIGLREQALGIETEKGLIAFLGCSHPGVDVLSESLRHFGEIYGIIGGFHDFSDIDYLDNFSLIIPTHCTKKRIEIINRFPEKSMVGGSGFRLLI